MNLQEFINPINVVIDIMREQGLKYRVSDFRGTENRVYVDNVKRAIVVSCAYDFSRCGKVLKSRRNRFLSYANARILDHDISFTFPSQEGKVNVLPELEVSSKLKEFEQIRVRYFTGRSFSTNIPDGIGRNGKQRYKRAYRSGVMTALGDIEQEEWESQAKSLIDKYDEWGLYNQLLQWYSNIGFFGGYSRTDKKRERYILQVHISRIFDNKKWRDYIQFNKKYRPNVLQSGINNTPEAP